MAKLQKYDERIFRRSSSSCAFFFQNDLKQFLEKMSTSFNYAKELFRHNMVRRTIFSSNMKIFFCLKKVVFQNGEGALQVLPPLVDVIPEARLNLVIYYLKEGELFIDEIYSLLV